MRLAGIWLFGKRRAHAGVGIVSGSQIGAEAGEIAGANGGRRHRERPRQRPLHPLAFVAAEEERAVPDERPAERAAELVLAQRRNRLALRLEVVRRVERVVAMELEERCRGTRSSRPSWRR